MTGISTIWYKELYSVGKIGVIHIAFRFTGERINQKIFWLPSSNFTPVAVFENTFNSRKNNQSCVINIGEDNSILFSGTTTLNDYDDFASTVCYIIK